MRDKPLMRLLYGLCGEGMDHATRSKVSIEHLKRRGHEVLISASGQTCDPKKEEQHGESTPLRRTDPRTTWRVAYASRVRYKTRSVEAGGINPSRL